MAQKKKKEEEVEKPFIIMYKDFMINQEYDVRDQFVYLLLKGFAHQRYGNISIASVDSILSVLGFVVNSKNKQGIKESVEKLVNGDIIKMYSDIQCKNDVTEVKYSDTYFFKITDSPFDDGYFSKIYHEDFYKFIMMEEKNKMKVFAVYFNIISRMYDSVSSDRYTLPNIDEMERETGINRKTISKYIQVLMENKLIYYISMRKATDRTKNVYGRWEHRELVKRFAESN